MENSKPWYLSRTVWASMVAVAAAIGGLMGKTFGAAEQALITDMLLQLVGAVGGILALVGRFSATERISRSS